MEASPQGLMALTAGGYEWPQIGAPMRDLNSRLGPTCAGLRWMTSDTVVFAFNPDGNIRVNTVDLVTSEVATLRFGGFNDLFAGGDVAATFSNLGYWDSTGNGRSGNQRAVAVDDLTGSIAFMREDRSGVDVYSGTARIRVFDGPGNYGASFKQGVLHFLAPGKRMYRWSLEPRTGPDYLFTLPPWVRPICQFSGGWFLSWHDNVGGVVIWQGQDLEHGRIATQGIEANDPRIIRVGDEIHVLSASGAGELLHEGQRRILPLNDVNEWPLQNLLDPNVGPPVPPIPPIPPQPPIVIGDDMLPTLLASHFKPYWENPSELVALQGDPNDPRWLRLNLEGVISWRAGVNGPGGIESDSAFEWQPGQTTVTAYRNGTEYVLKVKN